MEIYRPTIEKVKSLDIKLSKNTLADILLETFMQDMMTKNDKKLFTLAFSPNPTQEDLDKFLSDYDIEVAGSAKSLMLSYFMKMHPQLNFTEYETPRLKGLLNFFKFKNIRNFAHFKKIGKALNNANIPFLIIKGGVMKYLRPNLSRNMGDIDILLKNRSDFAKAGDIARELGYEFYEPNIKESNSIDLHEKDSDEGVVDIHWYINIDNDVNSRKIQKGIFERAKEENVFGVKAFVPSFEDILFLSLVNMTKNLRQKSSSTGVLFYLFDCKYLLENKPDFDWNIVIKNAQKSKSTVHLDFAIRFINKIVPDLLPSKLQNIFQKDIYDFSKLVMFDRFLYPEIHQKARDMRIKDYLTSDKIKEYLKFKPKYLFLKHIKNSDFLIKLFYDMALHY